MSALNTSALADAVEGVVNHDLLAGVLDEVAQEVTRSVAKHKAESMASPGHDLGKRLGILGEEFGEVCRATTYDNGSPENLREELVQTAAMAVAWLHALELEGVLEYAGQDEHGATTIAP